MWVGNGFGLHRIYSSALAALLNAGPYGFKDSSRELLEKNLLTCAATNILLIAINSVYKIETLTFF